MEISRNSFSKNRFDINDILEPKGKKTGIAGYHGGFWAIIGWIAAKILHKAVPIKTTKGVYYLNCKSLENWVRRVAPAAAPAGSDKGFSKKMHNPDAVAKMIESLKKPSATPITTTTQKKSPAKLKVYFETPQALWRILSQKSRAAHIDYLNPQDYPNDHRFAGEECPKNTAIIVDGRSLAANRVTEGMETRFQLVASQAPIKETEHLFWQWIFENDYSIMDLTSLEDQKKDITPYYPENLNETYTSGPFKITLIEKEGILRKYKVNTLTNMSKEVTRFHCTDWLDFGEGSLPLLKQLVEVIEKNPRILVHCRAGLGRTGTLFTAALLKEKIEKGEITLENLDGSLVDLIVSLRKNRGKGFVQTLGQFMMLQEYGKSLL